MKTSEKRGFNPITIELENEGEAQALKLILSYALWSENPAIKNRLAASLYSELTNLGINVDETETEPEE